MRNDFDDELNRESSRKKGAVLIRSQILPAAAGSPCLKDNHQQADSSIGRRNTQTAGRRCQTPKDWCKAAEENRARTNTEQENRRSRASKEEGRTPARDQIVIERRCFQTAAKNFSSGEGRCSQPVSCSYRKKETDP